MFYICWGDLIRRWQDANISIIMEIYYGGSKKTEESEMTFSENFKRIKRKNWNKI